MKIILCGNSKYLLYVFKGFLKANFKIKAIVTLTKEKQPKNSLNLIKYFRNKKIAFHITSDINSRKTYDFIKKIKPDLLFFSWPKIVDKKIIKLANYNSVGSHPSILPKNRGRHPLHWAKVMGIKSSGLTFFFLTKKIDGGEIIHKVYFKIKNKDDINSIEHKVNILAEKSCYLIAKKISSNTLNAIKQDGKNYNYLRKRNQSDLIINLKMNFKSIDQLVKSYVRPYDGAILIVNNQILRVSHVCITSNFLNNNSEIGKIIKISKKYIITKCIDSAIKIFLYKKINMINFKNKYIYDPSFYISRSKKLQNFFRLN